MTLMELCLTSLYVSGWLVTKSEETSPPAAFSSPSSPSNDDIFADSSLKWNLIVKETITKSKIFRLRWWTFWSFRRHGRDLEPHWGAWPCTVLPVLLLSTSWGSVRASRTGPLYSHEVSSSFSWLGPFEIHSWDSLWPLEVHGWNITLLRDKFMESLFNIIRK